MVARGGEDLGRIGGPLRETYERTLDGDVEVALARRGALGGAG
jgi:hypothetical protein